MIYQFERSRIERCDGCDFFYGGVDGMSYEYGYCTRHEDIIDGHKTPQDNDCPLVAISKTETTSPKTERVEPCEYCRKPIYLKWNVSFIDGYYKLNDDCNYCPACGRKLN